MSGLIEDFITGGEDHQNDQENELQEQLQEIEEKLEELGNTNTPEAGKAREELIREHHEVKIKLHQLQQQRAQEKEHSRGLDLFHD